MIFSFCILIVDCILIVIYFKMIDSCVFSKKKFFRQNKLLFRMKRVLQGWIKKRIQFSRYKYLFRCIL